MDRKQIYSAMENDVTKSLERFNAAASELINATYIIVSGKLSKLLQSVAGSRPLYEFLMSATEGYNFIGEFRAAQLRDPAGRAYIAVPTDPYEQIKFAFCMLFAIDTGKLNIEKLLHTYFYDADANTELRAFFRKIVKPFVENINAVFENAPTASVSIPDYIEKIVSADSGYAEPSQAPEPGIIIPPTSEPDFFVDSLIGRTVQEDSLSAVKNGDGQGALSERFSAVASTVLEPANGAGAENVADTKNSVADESLLASLGEVTCELMSVVAKSENVSIKEREELLIVDDAFNAALGFKELKSIKLMFTSLKNTVRCSEIASELEEKMSNLEYLAKGLL